MYVKMIGGFSQDGEVAINLKNRIPRGVAKSGDGAVETYDRKLGGPI